MREGRRRSRARVRVGVAGPASPGDASLGPASPAAALRGCGDDGLLVGLVPVEWRLPSRRARAPAQRGQPRVRGVPVGGRLGPPGQAVVQRPQPLRDLVHRGCRDDQETEEGQEQQERHRHPGRQGRRERGGGQVADHAAGVPHLVRAVRRTRQPGREMHQTRGGHAEGGQTDRDPVGGLDAFGMAQQPYPEPQEDQRQDERDAPDGARDDGVLDVAHPPGQPPPLAGGDDDGRSDEQQAEPVPPVRRIEVPGAGTDAPGRPTGEVGHAHPHPGDRPHGEGPSPRPASVSPGGAAPPPVAPGAGRRPRAAARRRTARRRGDTPAAAGDGPGQLHGLVEGDVPVPRRTGPPRGRPAGGGGRTGGHGQNLRERHRGRRSSHADPTVIMPMGRSCNPRRSPPSGVIMQSPVIMQSMLIK